jgi:4-hydroxy-3-methylbut-2-enyl diphosphate reductase
VEKMSVTIEKASEYGFCFGVRRAIKLVEEAQKKYGKVVTLGPIVHNQQVVKRLDDSGIRVMSNLERIKEGTVAITAHGASPEVLEAVTCPEITVVDTTCPIVRVAQKAAKKLTQDGFTVIIFGEKNHPEVKGLLGCAGENAIATLDSDDVVCLDLKKRAGILSQTTQNKGKFLEFVNQVNNAVLHEVRELRVVNTICDETEKRQDAAKELARRSDLVLVVGGRNSANTNRLAEICARLAETHLIEIADEIEGQWLAGKKHIGITAGTSTPDISIDEVFEKVQALCNGSD